MCPPNQRQEGYCEEENDLFTIDFSSVIDGPFYDSLTHGVSICGIPYNLDEPIFPPIQGESKVGNDDTPPAFTSSHGVPEDAMGRETNGSIESRNAEVFFGETEPDHCNESIEHPDVKMIEDQYCEQLKGCGKTFLLNQHNIFTDLMCQNALKKDQDWRSCGSPPNKSTTEVDILEDATLALFKTEYNPDGDEFTKATSANNVLHRGEGQIPSAKIDDPETDDGYHGTGGKRRRLICKVCGDTASGYHYRVASCEACKAFFKRTVQGKIEYACPAAGNCKISARGRKACQACRFVQCIKSGMLKEGVRADRKRGGRQKYFRRALSGQSLIYSTHPNGMSLDDNTLLNSLKGCSMSKDQLAMSVLKVETLTAPQIWIVLAELFNRYIEDVVNAINGISGFCDFSLDDKMCILKRSWSEVLILKFICHRDEEEPDSLRFASNFSISKKQAVECGMDEFFEICRKARKRIASFGGINPEELLILQALTLVNSDDYIEKKKEHTELKDNLLSLLTKQSLSSDTISSPTCAILHVQNILLLLTCIKEANMAMDGMWKEQKCEIDPSNKLLIEMIST